jgi:hypothetical protein
MPSREKGAKQFVVESHKVFANKLKRRLEFRGRDEQEFVDLAQALLNVHFELFVAAGMALAIGISFFESLGGRANVVSIFLHDQVHGGVIISLLSARSLLEFGIAKSLQHFCFVHSIRLVVEAQLQLAEFVRSANANDAA